MPGVQHGANTATSALPKVTGGREGGQACQPAGKDFREVSSQSNTPSVTALTVPTEGSWAAVGIPLVQMRKLRLERGGLMVSPGEEIIG